LVKTIIASGVVAMLAALAATPLLIRLLRSKGYGQPIRVDGPQSHQTKRGTPTMGGSVFVVASLIGYLVGHAVTGEPLTTSGVLVLLLTTGLGLVGFADDCIKIFRQTSLGLRSRTKLGGQIAIAAVFAWQVLQHPDYLDLTPADQRLSFLRDFGPVLGLVPFVIWVIIMVAGTSNAVNLVDGLDGLAAGATVPVLSAYVLIGLWEARNDISTGAASLVSQIYVVRDPLDLAVVAASVLGSCIGFLWWNAPPAKIFMGDTGSLALGGTLAGLAICTKTQLLLVILGGLFVAVTMSDVIQIGSYKLTKRRVFKMAPLQHHFELVGWTETTITIRFWIISGVCVGVGLGIFYASWMSP
jgi:phospho-N-acetylmuramoyl-pentapeptide-transferase